MADELDRLDEEIKIVTQRIVALKVDDTTMTDIEIRIGKLKRNFESLIENTKIVVNELRKDDCSKVNN